MSPLVLSVHDVKKAFGGAVALRGVDLTVGEGEVHALLGENGAGKSTLIKVLAGVHSPDGGTFEVAGDHQLPNGFGPEDVARAGIRFVHQDFGLVDTLSVMENMALVGGFQHSYGMIDYRASRRRAAEQLAHLGLDIDPAKLVGSLSVAEKAILALARAMDGNARLVIVDEVTAALPSPDVARVHDAIRAAAKRGVAFLYVSHRLEEIFQLCDRLTVLRDGRNVASADTGSVDMAKVVEWIAGKSVNLGRAITRSQGKPCLKASGIRGGLVEQPVDLAVAAGEILGITGIIGSGYDNICEMIAGIRRTEAGEVEIDGCIVTPGSTAASRAAGLEIVLGDRSRAAFAERSVRENLFADAVFRTRGIADLKGERLLTEELVSAFSVRPKGCSEKLIQSLSGGNQQKVLFARALAAESMVLVLVDPTAGVDVGARAELHDLLRSAAARGAAILFGSSDFEEIVAIAERVLVVRDGRVSSEVSGTDVTWDRLFMEAHGGSAQGSSGMRISPVVGP